MSRNQFKAKLFKIGSWTLIRLPEDISTKLPSRGVVMVEVTINGFPFQIVLEPDGKGSHWFRVNETMLKIAKIESGDTVTVTIYPIKEWIEPEVPADFKKALASVAQAHNLWMKITPMARWEWIRWIRSTKEPMTRKRRIEVACSKLKAGMRRPCCFNRNLCTEPYISHNGVLLEET